MIILVPPKLKNEAQCYARYAAILWTGQKAVTSAASAGILDVDRSPGIVQGFFFWGKGIAFSFSPRYNNLGYCTGTPAL